MGWLQQLAVPCLLAGGAALPGASAGGVRAGRRAGTAGRSLKTTVSGGGVVSFSMLLAPSSAVCYYSYFIIVFAGEEDLDFVCLVLLFALLFLYCTIDTHQFNPA